MVSVSRRARRFAPAGFSAKIALYFNLRAREELATYFSAVLTVPKVVVRFVPIPLTTVIMTTEMPAAIRPYSIAVAPDVSRRKLNKVFNATSSIVGDV
jgi:hypothetical protein